MAMSDDEFLFALNHFEEGEDAEDDLPFYDVPEAVGGLRQYQERASDAMFDALILVNRLATLGHWPSAADIHVLGYLACLLSVYRGLPASDWGYTFSAIPPMLPFSPAIRAALEGLEANGFVASSSDASPQTEPAAVQDGDGRRFTVTPDGVEEAAFLSSLGTYTDRAPFLIAAAQVAQLRSLPSVSSALAGEPGLSHASHSDRSQLLLVPGATSDPLYAQLRLLDRMLGERQASLVVPASLYLRFLEAEALSDLGPVSESQSA